MLLIGLGVVHLRWTCKTLEELILGGFAVLRLSVQNFNFQILLRRPHPAEYGMGGLSSLPLSRRGGSGGD